MIPLPAKILVTGTDTGVGKTYVSGELIQAASEAGLRVKAIKPLESGVENIEDSDAAYLWRKLNALKPYQGQSLEDVSMYQFKEPLSPHIAASRAGIEISKAELLEKINNQAKDSDLLVVEGAGGLRVPILNDYTYADLALDAGLSILIVAGNKLGVINHLLLTNEVARNLGLEVLPYILNDLHNDPQLAERTNLAAITNCSQLSCLAHIEFQKEFPKLIKNKPNNELNLLLKADYQQKD